MSIISTVIFGIMEKWNIGKDRANRLAIAHCLPPLSTELNSIIPSFQYSETYYIKILKNLHNLDFMDKL